MLTFVVDEDLPRSTTKELVKAGYQVFDVRDAGLRGKGDNEIFLFAQKHSAVLISADLDFANIIRFQVGSNNGIIVLRFPNELSNETINKELLAALARLKAEDVYGKLIIVEPGKIRLHKVSPK